MIILLEVLDQSKFPPLLDQQVSISSGSMDIDELMKLVDFFTGKVILSDHL